MRQNLLTVRRASPPSTAPEARLQAAEKFLSQSLTTPRIIIADDDSTTGDWLRATAEYDVVAVTGGRQAFRRLKADAAFNLAIFHISMRDLSTIEIIQYMKTEKRLMGIPVVVIGGDGKLDVLAKAFAAGAIAVLPERFDRDQLTRVVRLALNARTRQQVRRAR